jgi:ubiquinone biosynthesis monooxygenase Coq7
MQEGTQHPELVAAISKFRDEEQEHHDTGLEHDAELAPAYQVRLIF